jgi:hypothetical protein
MSAFRHSHRRGAVAGLLLVTITAIGLGCGGNDVSYPEPSEKGVLDRDVAESVASDLARDSGGLIDQMGDLLEMAIGATFEESMRVQGGGLLWAAIQSAEFDEAKGDWTLAIDRERGAPTDAFYARAERVYKVTFANADGSPQKYFDTDGVLASRIHLSVSSGTGAHHCPDRAHTLTEVTGSFLATGTDTPDITVNGTYHRRGVSTIDSVDGEIVVTRQLDLTVTDLVGRRGADPYLAQTVTGTLSGDLRAEIETAAGGEPRLVDRSIEVTLGGGEAIITSGTASYTGDLQAGEIQADGLR